MNQTFKLKKENNALILLKCIDTKESVCVCPYSAPVIVPGQLAGQMQLLPRICDNNCALFEITENQTVVLNCTKTTYKVNLF